ncbi:uncharacterized protein LOC111686737 [Lucilia cuprina]|uniref:uncharacterized protein LOC111686737 n=1 Tax=Lucilia cuprina TaxID=7375 RepID=UPI001F05DA14|nr:uncharacterized protein LOC111686737 [Lucilia cuprina]
MDQQQQTQQTEKIIVEMLEFLDSSSEEENDHNNISSEKCLAEDKHIEKDINDNLLPIKLKSKSQNIIKNNKKPVKIAKELKKLKQEFPIWNTKEIAANNKNVLTIHKTPEILEKSNIQHEVHTPADDTHIDWFNKLETNCRRSSSNLYLQEIHRAIYQDTTGHPPSSSAEYYQAAQNYALYGKNFLDFPDNLQVLMNDKNSPNSGSENSNLITNFGQCFYPTQAEN